MGFVPDYILKKCETELNETSENKLNGIYSLRNMTQGDHVAGEIHFEDDFLVQFLRHSKYDVKKALKHIQNYVNLRKKRKDMFESFPDDFLSEQLSKDFLLLMPKRSPDGCAVILLQVDLECKNPFGEGLTTMGMVAVEAENCMPTRVKGLHIINESFIVRIVWPVMKHLMSEKIGNRAYPETISSVSIYIRSSAAIAVPRMPTDAQYQGDEACVIFRSLSATPDLTPSDFHLFFHLKSFLAGKHFNNDKELKENVSNSLKTQAATFYEEGIEKLVPRYDTCLQNFGSYVER
ncbi:alpha-tocopherol transfer protein-like [Trichonephila clavipes]|nr:alpha-tocopherol transfer protein-like [Trichonephila clavipes]